MKKKNIKIYGGTSSSSSSNSNNNSSNSSRYYHSSFDIETGRRWSNTSHPSRRYRGYSSQNNSNISSSHRNLNQNDFSIGSIHTNNSSVLSENCANINDIIKTSKLFELKRTHFNNITPKQIEKETFNDLIANFTIFNDQYNMFKKNIDTLLKTKQYYLAEQSCFRSHSRIIELFDYFRNLYSKYLNYTNTFIIKEYLSKKHKNLLEKLQDKIEKILLHLNELQINYTNTTYTKYKINSNLDKKFTSLNIHNTNNIIGGTSSSSSSNSNNNSSNSDRYHSSIDYETGRRWSNTSHPSRRYRGFSCQNNSNNISINSNEPIIPRFNYIDLFKKIDINDFKIFKRINEIDGKTLKQIEKYNLEKLLVKFETFNLECAVTKQFVNEFIEKNPVNPFKNNRNVLNYIEYFEKIYKKYLRYTNNSIIKSHLTPKLKEKLEKLQSVISDQIQALEILKIRFIESLPIDNVIYKKYSNLLIRNTNIIGG